MAGTIWALGIKQGFDIAIVSDLPLGSGLSSSAAMECSIALGAAQLVTEDEHSEPDRNCFITTAITAENDVVGASTGGLDQRASLLGAAGKALVLDFFSGNAHLVDCDFATAGLSLLVASHESLRDDFEVVTPELESAFQAALGTGALGARMTGGGFGGSVIALVKESNLAEVAESIVGAAAKQGFPEPSFLVAQPSARGRRLS